MRRTCIEWSPITTLSIFIGCLSGLLGCSSGPTIEDKLLAQASNPERITARLYSQRHYFESCRSSFGADRLNGSLVVRFKVNADGHAVYTHVYESIGQSSALDRCLEEATQNLRFDPMPQGVVAEVEYPMHFSSNINKFISKSRQPAAASNATQTSRPLSR